MTSNALPNSSFSEGTPLLQTSIDSTSLGEFKQCPRKYQLRIIEGWVPKTASPHLVFGIVLHSSRVTYDKARASGSAHPEALAEALHSVLKATWNSELRRPWISDHPQKNRLSLARAIVWYLDQFASGDSVETVRVGGDPALELRFQFDSGHVTQAGEPFILCGHIDRIGEMNGDAYIIDIKTTAHSLGPHWFLGFSPDNQFSLYVLAGQVILQKPIRGLIVDGIQVGAGFARFQRGLILRDQDQIAEWHRDLGEWLGQMERAAKHRHWPQNDKACGLYGGCQFREVCARTPKAREPWLRANFRQETWDPLAPRAEA